METWPVATFKSTGATGDVLDKTTRSGLGDLDGTWYYVRFDNGETMWVHANDVTIVRPEVIA